MRFAADSNLELVFTADKVRGLTANSLDGTMTAAQALTRLLQGSGMTYRFINAHSVTLEQQPGNFKKTATTPDTPEPHSNSGASGSETTLEKVTVEADADNPYDDPTWQTDPYKTDTPLIETPLNVQVMSKQVLKDQQVISLDKALNNVSGVTITTNANQNGEETYLRGFATKTLFRNGFRVDANNVSSSNGQQFANVESIEVLKGPAAILFGRVEPGGLVNIITKQPLATPYYSLNQQFGSYDLFRTSIDATGPLTKDDTLLYRINASFQNNNSFRDLISNENVFLTPIVKWNITPRTQATLEMEYQHDKYNFDSQFLPFDQANNRFIDLPHQRNLGERNPVETETFFAGFNWSHQFNDDWSIKHQVNFKRVDFNQGLGVVPIAASLDDNTISRSLFTNQSVNDTGASILDLTGHFKTWGLEHTLLFGGDYYRFNTKRKSLFSDDLSIISFDNPVHPGTDAALNPAPFLVNSNTDNYGLYLQDQIKLPYNVQILGGLRYQYIHSESTTDDLFFQSSTTTVQTADAVTPRVGLLWNPKKWLSLYSNYTENFDPNTQGALLFTGFDPSGIPLPGAALAPTSAQQWEVGAKTEFFDGRLQATLAYYDLTKQNVASSHPDPFLAGLGFFVAAGEVRSRGQKLILRAKSYRTGM